MRLSQGGVRPNSQSQSPVTRRLSLSQRTVQVKMEEVEPSKVEDVLGSPLQISSYEAPQTPLAPTPFGEGRDVIQNASGTSDEEEEASSSSQQSAAVQPTAFACLPSSPSNSTQASARYAYELDEHEDDEVSHHQGAIARGPRARVLDRFRSLQRGSSLKTSISTSAVQMLSVTTHSEMRDDDQTQPTPEPQQRAVLKKIGSAADIFTQFAMGSPSSSPASLSRYAFPCYLARLAFSSVYPGSRSSVNGRVRTTKRTMSSAPASIRLLQK